jgi:TrmH RNA methyltransferase
LRICGLAAVRALFERAPGRVERLFFEPRLKADLAAFCGMLSGVGKPYREADAATLARVGGTARHGGVVAVALPQPIGAFDAQAPSDWARDGKPILVLDGVGNRHDLCGEPPPALVFGNEEAGLDPRTLAACDAIATIPGSGRIQSLNVAAAAILIYLATR